MDWYVFKKNDKKTWPKINCPIVVIKEYSQDNVCIIVCEWDSNRKQFLEKNTQYYEFEECFYAYLGWIPYIEKEFLVLKCGDETSRCEYQDDGYCWHGPKGCTHAREEKEYSIGLKRNWKV